MENLFDLTYLITNYGYMGILIIVFLESGVFFPLPGDSLLFTAGLLAPTLGWNVISLTLSIFFVAFLGGIVGYFIGTKLDFLYNYSLFRKIFKKKYTDDAYDFLEKHGLFAMILSRFIPIVRTFLPIVAGMVRMNFYQFLKYSFAGSFVWSATFVFGGYFLGRAFPQISGYLHWVIIIIVIITVLPGVYHFIRDRKEK
jgi:membrane-associated protein